MVGSKVLRYLLYVMILHSIRMTKVDDHANGNTEDPPVHFFNAGVNTVEISGRSNAFRFTTK
eukprot:m.123903 g.123903  ORF g.123903 m.123903 type:complete len:62 (-) comp14459_c1_seq7:1449-1634(-)